MESECRNARVESTSLGYMDHGILSFWLHLDYGGAGQGFGGYALDECGDRKTYARKHSAYCGSCIENILKVCGVDKWEDLPNTYLKAHIEDGIIRAISHVLKDEITFRPQRLFAELKGDFVAE